jgi:hypothetical protein
LADRFDFSRECDTFGLEDSVFNGRKQVITLQSKLFNVGTRSGPAEPTLTYNSALNMAGFDDAWSAVARPYDGEFVSAELRPLLHAVYRNVVVEPPDLAALKGSLEALLEYLNGAGRTNANCWAVDMFFCTSEGWERDWTEQNLPDDFHHVLAMMGEALHDTVRTPHIAENFDCLPEQLLERVRLLRL